MARNTIKWDLSEVSYNSESSKSCHIILTLSEKFLKSCSLERNPIAYCLQNPICQASDFTSLTQYLLLIIIVIIISLPAHCIIICTHSLDFTKYFTLYISCPLVSLSGSSSLPGHIQPGLLTQVDRDLQAEILKIYFKFL